MKDDKEALEENISEAQDVLDEMKIEIVTVTEKARKDGYIAKMNEYNAMLNKFRKQALGGSSASVRANQTQEQRGEQSLEALRKAQAQLYETEQIGVNTLENLNKQKETIKNTKKNTEEINQNLSYSNKLLNRMGKWWRG